MGKLLGETDEAFIVEDYVHYDPDERDEWTMDEEDNPRFDEDWEGWYNSRLYETRVVTTIDKKTGKTLKQEWG